MPQPPDVNSLIAQALQRKRTLLSQIEVPQVASKAYASPKLINRYGPTYEVFNPALEQVKEGSKGVVETQQAMKALNTIFEKAEQDIPAMPKQKQAFKKGVSRGLGRLSVMGQVPAQMFGRADEGAMSYHQIREAFGTQIARGLGERGVVTNQDVERIMRALPKDNDTVNVRARNKEYINTILRNRIEQYNKIYETLRSRRGNPSLTVEQGTRG